MIKKWVGEDDERGFFGDLCSRGGKIFDNIREGFVGIEEAWICFIDKGSVFNLG